MWTAKWILDNYEAGNEAVRLEMYMAYPDLRSCFEGLDSRSDEAGGEETGLAAEKTAGMWWNHCYRLVRG